MWAVIKKEFKSYFYTPIGYIFIGVFLVAFSISFYFSVISSGNVNFEYIYYTLPTILVLAFIIPLLTMRSFSEERKTGTEQLLLTSPISITKVVLGKFIAALLIVIITELCTFMYFGILCHYGVPKLYLIWYDNIKFNRKPNNSRNNLNRIFHNNMGFTRIQLKFRKFFFHKYVL